MATITSPMKRPLSRDQRPPGDEPLNSPAKRRRVTIEGFPIEAPAAPEIFADPEAQRVENTAASVERAFALRSAFGSDNLPIECNCPPLRGRSDYRGWRRKMRVLLDRNFLLGLVEGKIGQLPQSHRFEYELKNLNAAAKMIINANLSVTTRPIVRNMHNPQEMWQKLEKHCKPSDWSLARSGWLELQNIKYSQCADAWEYVYRVDDAWRCICLDGEDAFEKHEMARCTSLVCGLDTPKWESWKMRLLSDRRASIPSWESLVKSLTSAEDKGIVSDVIGMAI
ncbi:uncharacterized protein N7515_005051 [Penicillium bovifimosum]|uniref:Uncharacterized protein n=1 Tax=Penicillium bovifimosum TaxID=126998 RepID=A0A9W9H2W8_9EURO|nr:uncharacterized protein N7515_005051 [Penicillium bovifimosum]KAJ5135773.1 hypothetical protein N7515_005051 [Penicillium bovifimosum]